MKKGLQSLAFAFEEDYLTHSGGLFLIQRFCNQLSFAVGFNRWRARSYDAYQRLAEKAGFKELKMGWAYAEFRHPPQSILSRPESKGILPEN